MKSHIISEQSQTNPYETSIVYLMSFIGHSKHMKRVSSKYFAYMPNMMCCGKNNTSHWECVIPSVKHVGGCIMMSGCVLPARTRAGNLVKADWKIEGKKNWEIVEENMLEATKHWD